jgi:hypothetical protein
VAPVSGNADGKLRVSMLITNESPGLCWANTSEKNAGSSKTKHTATAISISQLFILYAMYFN